MLEGRTVENVRLMNEEELEHHGWEHSPYTHLATVIEFQDGSKLYPSRDAEGNGPGCLFGEEADGNEVYVVPEEEEE